MKALGKYVLDSDGQPQLCDDVLDWGAWMESTMKRQLAHTTVAHGVEVSTVFLGLDHNFSGQGAPVLWETMVFGGGLDGEQVRYTSRQEALAGHAEMVDRVTAANSTAD